MTLRDINLIPDDILFFRELWQHLYIWVIFMAISLFLISGFYIYQRHSIHSRKLPSTALEELNKNLNIKMSEINQVKGESDRFDQQESLIDTISGGPEYSLIISRLADIMNDYTWLTRLTIDSETDKENILKLIMYGFSSQNTNLVNFIEKLSRDPSFRAVVLKYARGATGDDASTGSKRMFDLIQFQIECEITGWHN